MALTLQKQQSISLAKTAGSSLTSISLGLGLGPSQGGRFPRQDVWWWFRDRPRRFLHFAEQRLPKNRPGVVPPTEVPGRFDQALR